MVVLTKETVSTKEIAVEELWAQWFQHGWNDPSQSPIATLEEMQAYSVTPSPMLATTCGCGISSMCTSAGTTCFGTTNLDFLCGC